MTKAHFAGHTERAGLIHTNVCGLLRLFRVLKLFLSVGTNIVKHYTTMGVHKSFPQGVVSLVILRDFNPMNVRLK